MQLPSHLRPAALAFAGVLAACSSAPSDGAISSSVGAVQGAEDAGVYCQQPGRFAAGGSVVVDRASDAQPVEWQREVPSASYTYAEAVAYCDALTLDGGGWRLPSVSELASLVLHPIGLGGSPLPTCVPSIDQVAFPSTPADDFWSSTTRPVLEDAMYTGFYDGRSHADRLDTPMSVRCVRPQ